jgi:ABC-2 type transport system ATP-binding protein
VRTSNKIVEVANLVKVYPNGVRAVADVSFNVEPGEFIGLLGPNGAGKSTIIKIMATLIRKTSGKVIVAGYDIDTQALDVRRNIGVALQDVGLDDLANARDFLKLQGMLYGLPRNKAESRAEELLELVGLKSVANRKVGTYSGGMRRRVDLVSALMHDPTVIFLDEPTTGLDPQSRLNIWEYLQQLNQAGKTIFLTTQLMDEADRLCQRIAIIDNGKIVASGVPKELKAEVGGDVITLNLDSVQPDSKDSVVERAESIIAGREYVLSTNKLDNSLNITVKEGGRVIPDILRLLQEERITVTNLSLSSPTLDDVFLKYTGRKIRTEEAQSSAENQAARSILRVGRR